MAPRAAQAGTFAGVVSELEAVVRKLGGQCARLAATLREAQAAAVSARRLVSYFAPHMLERLGGALAQAGRLAVECEALLEEGRPKRFQARGRSPSGPQTRPKPGA